MKTQPNPNGFHVNVLDGVEVSEKQVSEMSEDKRGRVKHVLNGPHHDARWARDRARSAQYEQHRRVFFGTHERYGVPSSV